MSDASQQLVDAGADSAAWLARETGLSEAAARQVADYLADGRRVLGTVPTQQRVIAERFFDESGGMQLVLHAPFGGRINRAWGLALRKRFCRGFGFELQAAANEEAIVISLGPQHSFPLDSVFEFLQPDSAREVLIQALLDQPMFASRWRWNTTRSLMLERFAGGKRVPAALIRMRAVDLLTAAFPQVVACPENLPGGDLPVPMNHAIVRQTIEDCLHEAMDVDGFVQLIRDLRDGRIERIAVDTPEPSAFARAILASQPYTFLDDAPLEERRTQAVISRRTLDPRSADQLGALDPEAVRRVQEEVWPRPESADEVHEALLWMGYVADDEAAPWRAWLDDLAAAGRVERIDGCWFAAESPRDPKVALAGRLEALGPVYADSTSLRGCASSVLSEPRPSGSAGRTDVFPPCTQGGQGGFPLPHGRGSEMPKEPLPHGRGSEMPKNPLPHGRGSEIRGAEAPAAGDEIEPLLRELESEGRVLRTRWDGRPAWCERRLLARIHRHTLDRLRSEIQPVTAAQFMQFLACWQHADEPHRLEGPRGVAEVVQQLAGCGVPAALWETRVLPARVRDFRREWLDELTLLGEVVWGRFWGGGACPIRKTPVCLVPRDDLDVWLALADEALPASLPGAARDIVDALTARGPMFPQEIQRTASLLPAHLEMGLAELIGHGLITCDSFGGLRQLITPPSKRRTQIRAAGRWSLLRTTPARSASEDVLTQDSGLRTQDLFSNPQSAIRSPKSPRETARERHERESDRDAQVEFAARQLLRRYGVIFRRVIQRERLPVAWYEMVRVLRRLELRGDVRGGRFVAGFAGEQYAMPGAVELLRRVRRDGPRPMPYLDPADPLNLDAVLSAAPDSRVQRVPA